jgi:hypothetical protein
MARPPFGLWIHPNSWRKMCVLILLWLKTILHFLRTTIEQMTVKSPQTSLWIVCTRRTRRLEGLKSRQSRFAWLVVGPIRSHCGEKWSQSIYLFDLFWPHIFASSSSRCSVQSFFGALVHSLQLGLLSFTWIQSARLDLERKKKTAQNAQIGWDFWDWCAFYWSIPNNWPKNWPVWLKETPRRSRMVSSTDMWPKSDPKNWTVRFE